jgi:hypothetical protein
VTLHEALYTTRVELQQPPTVNLIANPNAQVNLSNASGNNLNLTRYTPATANADYQTAFMLAAIGNNDGWLTVGAGAGSIHEGLEEGVQYTVRGTFHIDAPLSGSEYAGRSRRIVLFTRVGAGAYTVTASAAAPNTVGSHNLSLTFTVPSGVTEAFLRFYHGHSAGTAFWWRLRLSEGTETTFFDGETYDGPYFTDAEYGWDGAPGVTTSWRADRATNIALDDARMEISYDIRRVPYMDATITAPLPDAATLAQLDPRQSRPPILNWNLTRFQRSGGPGGPLDAHHSSAPLAYPADVAGKLFVRSLRVDLVSRVVSIRAVSGEVITEDKHNISDVAHPTTATNVDELVTFAVNDAGGQIVYSDTLAGLTPIPLGDRRIWLQGESLSQLYESELAALDLRLFSDEVEGFHVRPFTLPPTWDGTNSTLTDGDAGTLHSFQYEIDRENWRDATLVKADYDDASGVRQTDMQAYPASGANRKGAVTTISRAIPSSTYAESITLRGADRTDRVTVEAQLDFKHKPGRNIDVTVDGDTTTIAPETVTYRPAEGTMTIVGFRV